MLQVLCAVLHPRLLCKLLPWIPCSASQTLPAWLWLECRVFGTGATSALGSYSIVRVRQGTIAGISKLSCNGAGSNAGQVQGFASGTSKVCGECSRLLLRPRHVLLRTGPSPRAGRKVCITSAFAPLYKIGIICWKGRVAPELVRRVDWTILSTARKEW